MTLPQPDASSQAAAPRGPRRRFPGGGRERAALAFALVALAVLVGALVGSAADAFRDDALVSLCTDAFVSEFWVATIAVALALFAKTSLHGSLGLGPGRLPFQQIGVLVVGTLATSHALDGWLELSGLAEGSLLREIPRSLEGARGTRLIAALLILGVAPGIAEELLCRGVIQRGLTRRLGPLAGIFGSALLFGALHVEPVHAGLAALLGLYLGAAAHWSGSTRVPMVCHAVNNLSVVWLAASGSDWASPSSTIAAALLGPACLIWVARHHPPGSTGPGPT